MGINKTGLKLQFQAVKLRYNTNAIIMRNTVGFFASGTRYVKFTNTCVNSEVVHVCLEIEQTLPLVKKCTASSTV